VASAVKQSRVLRIDGLEPGTLSHDLQVSPSPGARGTRPRPTSKGGLGFLF